MYETRDYYLASALRVAVDQPLPTVVADGRFCVFRFALDPNKAERVAGEFYNDALVISARRYAQTLQDLKTLIHRAREAQGR